MSAGVALFLLVAFLALTARVQAAVLPDDRVDALYHAYDGGGVEVTGPSVLVLKKIGEKAAINGNYYLDQVSSASVDVVTQGSPYEEERTQWSIGGQYLHGKTTLGLAYTNSEESDYEANTATLSFSTDVFGDLTTVTLGYSYGWDVVRRNLPGTKTPDPEFNDGKGESDTRRQNYRLGISQILTKSLIMTLNWETITDEGDVLNNPYRSVRVLDDSVDLGYVFVPERYPDTRTSNALSLGLRYYLPFRAALRGHYRRFEDTWGISADTAEIGWTQPIRGGWNFDFRYRWYSQSNADFYQDLFLPVQGESQNFLARDKELSTFTSNTLGLGIVYEFGHGRGFLERGSLNLKYDYMLFDYEDYRDLTVRCSSVSAGVPPGCEPLYSFSADVWQLFASFWF